MTLPIPHVAPGESISEADFQRVLYQHLNAPHRLTRVWRQNSGAVTTRSETGKVTGRFQGAITGAADLSGIVGPLGLRLEIEVKVKHKHTPQQIAFGQVITKLGGIYVLVRYDPTLTLAANVERGLRIVDEAIAARSQAHVP